jgi:hypothetical protein
MIDPTNILFKTNAKITNYIELSNDYDYDIHLTFPIVLHINVIFVCYVSFTVLICYSRSDLIV